MGRVQKEEKKIRELPEHQFSTIVNTNDLHLIIRVIDMNLTKLLECTVSVLRFANRFLSKNEGAMAEITTHCIYKIQNLGTVNYG